DGCSSVDVDLSGNIYITGYFEETVDLDPGPGIWEVQAHDNEDVFVSKFDSVGNLLMCKTWGGNSSDMGWGIRVDAIGNIYTTGWFDNMVDFDPGSGMYYITTNGNDDVFLHMLPSDGIW
ncbi:unnamed protein product, partial [marine sediment metagenome]